MKANDQETLHTIFWQIQMVKDEADRLLASKEVSASDLEDFAEFLEGGAAHSIRKACKYGLSRPQDYGYKIPDDLVAGITQQMDELNREPQGPEMIGP